MADKVRFVVNPAGLSELLTSNAVRADLRRRADRVAAAGGSNLTIEDGTSPGGGRVSARARVRIGYPATMSPIHALRSEAKYGTLAKALGAAGGG